MNIRDQNLRDMAAAEYVLGTLRGGARRRFERLLGGDSDLRQRVARWEQVLVPLATGIGAVAPSARSWEAIQRRIGVAQNRADARSWFGWPLRVWLATAAVVLAVGLFIVPPLQERLTFRPDVEVAIANEAQEVLWVIEADTQHNRLHVRAVRDVPIPDDKSLELWLLLADGGAPVSLGLMPEAKGSDQILRPAAQLRTGNGFAVSLEPRGGSPTGQATGPILHVQTFGSTT